MKERQVIEGFCVKDMLDGVVEKYLKKTNAHLPEETHHVLYEYPVYEKVNDEIWFIYFTSWSKSSPSKYGMKIYHQIVMGFGCMEEYYYNLDMIDVDKNKSLDDLKERFRNYLNWLLKRSDETKSL
jgi:hypothetical protein